MNTKELFDAAAAQAFPDGGKPIHPSDAAMMDAADAMRQERAKAAPSLDDLENSEALITGGPVPSAGDGKPAESEWSLVADTDDATDAAAMWSSVADFADKAAPDHRPSPGERIVAAKRACEGKGSVSPRWDACARLAYAKEQRLAGTSTPDAEHATMAEAVAAVTSASLTLARIERKVDALATDNPAAPLVANLVELVKAMSARVETVPLDIVFDGPPGHESGRFVEVERDGVSINAGAWRKRDDGLWALRIDYVADRSLLCGLADDVQRDASAVGIRATPDAGSPDDTPANRIRNVVGQLVERLRPLVPMPPPSADMIELGQRAYREAFGEYAGHPSNPGIWTWWTVSIGFDAAHALNHDDPPALRPNERPGDEWKPANWIGFRDAVRRLHAETPAP